VKYQELQNLIVDTLAKEHIKRGAVIRSDHVADVAATLTEVVASKLGIEKPAPSTKA
jgi:hypothetical protein